MALRRFRYNMTHQWITSTRIGRLQPFLLQEVTPGDTWHGPCNGLIRMAPMDLPAFVTFNVHCYMFFIPHRIIWDEFEDVVTGEDGVTPWPQKTVTNTNWGSPGVDGSLPKAFGLGRPGSFGYDVSDLPFRAYLAVYNEFFRDQDYEPERTLTDSVALVKFPASDYFGGARSEIQQGAESTVDVSGSTLGVTEIRDAFHRQKFKERRSQYGARYTDYLMAMGLNVPDSRLDRPEVVGRNKATIGVSEVVATATSTGENTGQYRGHGIAGVGCNLRKRMFLEHGYLMGLFTIRPRLQINRRVDRLFLVNDKDDLFQQELARDTQVAIEAQEVATEGLDNATRQEVFGYTARDQWLRTARDTIASEMQGDALNSNPLEGWHIARNFQDNTPSLLEVQQVWDVDQIFQDQTSAAQQAFCFFNNGLRKSSIIPRRVK